MVDSENFIEIVNNICLRPKMFTLNGTFGEVAAVITGIEITSPDSPISNDDQSTLSFFITNRLRVPSKFWWPGAIRMVAENDEAAIMILRDLLVEFATLRKTMSLEEIRELAARVESKYIESEPAKAWRQFLSARYSANRAHIEPLIMPHPDAFVLWRGEPTPTDVAAQLNSISDLCPVSVVAGSIDSGHVTLITELGRIDAHLVDDSWRVDAAPIIELDKNDA